MKRLRLFRLKLLYALRDPYDLDANKRLWEEIQKLEGEK